MKCLNQRTNYFPQWVQDEPLFYHVTDKRKSNYGEGSELSEPQGTAQNLDQLFEEFVVIIYQKMLQNYYK